MYRNYKNTFILGIYILNGKKELHNRSTNFLLKDDEKETWLFFILFDDYL